MKVVIASARPPRSVRHIYQALEAGHLADQLQRRPDLGRAGRDRPSSTAAWPAPLVRSIIDHARDLFPEVLGQLRESLDRWYTDRDDQRLHHRDRPAVQARTWSRPLDDVLHRAGDQAAAAGPARRDRPTLEPSLLRAVEPSTSRVVRSDPELLQVMHHRVSKAAALRRVARHYGVPMDRVMAIGDAANDVGMLQARRRRRRHGQRPPARSSRSPTGSPPPTTTTASTRRWSGTGCATEAAAAHPHRASSGETDTPDEAHDPPRPCR